MDSRQLEYFVAVAEELSFTRAAARCHLVQSALSSQIARLEREQGLALFERTSRSVRLTAAGALLLPRARAVLCELEAARSGLAELTGVITGRLRLRCNLRPMASRRGTPARSKARSTSL